MRDVGWGRGLWKGVCGRGRGGGVGSALPEEAQTTSGIVSVPVSSFGRGRSLFQSTLVTYVRLPSCSPFFLFFFLFLIGDPFGLTCASWPCLQPSPSRTARTRSVIADYLNANEFQRELFFPRSTKAKESGPECLRRSFAGFFLSSFTSKKLLGAFSPVDRERIRSVFHEDKCS